MPAFKPALNPQRSVDVCEPFALYEIIGRRPSAVYLDAGLQPLVSGDGPHRLNEFVYRPGRALPGEQIHLASGRTFVLDADNVYRAVLLTDPRPISVETALVHAAQDRAAEENKIEALVQSGAVVEARARRSQGPKLPRYDTMFGADQPLVAD
jgi:hypothetical protein